MQSSTSDRFKQPIDEHNKKFSIYSQISEHLTQRFIRIALKNATRVLISFRSNKSAGNGYSDIHTHTHTYTRLMHQSSHQLNRTQSYFKV